MEPGSGPLISGTEIDPDGCDALFQPGGHGLAALAGEKKSDDTPFVVDKKDDQRVIS
jgi:hypothetical protein